MPLPHQPTIETAANTPWSVEHLTQHNAVTFHLDSIMGSIVAKVCEQIPADRPTVELGCGLGHLGKFIPASHRSFYTQTELGLTNCQIAKNTNPDLLTVAANVQELPFRSESIGTVIARNLFDVVDSGSFADETARILKPGGQIVHMHDRRPSMSWIHEQLQPDESSVVFPYIEGGAVKQLQLFAAADFEREFPEHRAQLQTLSDPHWQESFMSGASPQKTARFAELCLAIRDRINDVNILPSPSELMDYQFRALFEEKRLMAQSGDVTGQHFTSRQAVPLSLALAPEDNMRIHHSNGSFVSVHLPEIPNNIVGVQASVLLSIAQKPEQ